MRNRLLFIITTLSFSVLLFFMNCDHFGNLGSITHSTLDGGTDTGNPKSADEQTSVDDGDVSSGGNSNSDQSLVVDEIVGKSCIKLRACSGLEEESCHSLMNKDGSLPVAFGLSQGLYSDLMTVKNAILKGKIRADITQSNFCLVTISNLSCDDKDLQSVFKDKDSNLNGQYNFSKLFVSSESCKKILSTVFSY